MKYTVPPETLAPLGAVGWVRPGPVVGPAAEVDAADELLLLEDPQAAAISTTETTPTAAVNPRMPLRIFVPRLIKTASPRTSNLLIRAIRWIELRIGTIGSPDYRALTDG